MNTSTHESPISDARAEPPPELYEDDEQAPPANPFAVAAPAPTAVSAAVAQEREIAEVQAAMIIAKRFPRDQRDAMDRVLMACARPTLAEAALYSYSRGGQEVTGPSIRLAEAMAQAWGNLQVGVRELEQRDGESTVEAYAWDLETNLRQSKVFQVAHERHTRQGTKKLTDPRDIYELVANQGARRLRACILAAIPGDVTEAAVRQCDVTLRNRVELTPERIKAMLDLFATYGVTKEQIEKRIQRHLDSITPGLFLQLGKIANSLRDGMSQPGDWFETDAAAASHAKPRTAAPKAKPAQAEPDPARNA